MTCLFDVEVLEGRTFFAAAEFQFANFASTAKLVGNGFQSTAMTAQNKLRLTSGEFHQSRSVWYGSAVPVERFATEFTFRSNANVNGADGLTFSLINGPTSALGADGRGLGYGNIAAKSVAVAFNQFNFAQFGSRFGFATNGERPPTLTKMGTIDLHNGHTFKVMVGYNGSLMSVVVIDTDEPGKIFRASKAINIPRVLGSKTATVGFTAATGSNAATQDVTSWSFSGDAAPAQAPVPTKPRFASSPAASPRPVTGKTVQLTTLGSDSTDSESELSYAWRIVSKPMGAAIPAFSANNSNVAKNTIATFTKDGNYVFRATVTNTAGLFAIRDVSVRVNQTATAVSLTPHKKQIRVGRAETYRAAMLDQFNRPMRTQPTFRYSIQSGGGTMNARTGLYRAPETVGHVVIEATANGLTGVAGALIEPKDVHRRYGE